MLKSNPALIYSLPAVVLDQEGFEDLDAFWNLSISKGNAPITPKAKVHENAQPAPNTVSTSTSLPDDFNYEDSDSITEDEQSDSDNDSHVIDNRTPDAKSTSYDDSVYISGSSKRNSIRDSDMSFQSRMTLNSTIPDESFQSNAKSRDFITRDSISSEINNSAVSNPDSKRRGRKSSLESNRSGAKGPVNFNDNPTPKSDEEKRRESISPARVEEKPITPIVNTPKQSDKLEKTSKSNLKKGKSTPQLSSTDISRQVSFEASAAESDGKVNIHNSKSKETESSPTGDYFADSPQFDYNDIQRYQESPVEEVTASIANERSTKSFASTPATSVGISTPGSSDFIRGTQLNDSAYTDRIEDDDSDTDEEELNESFVVETSFNESLLKKSKSSTITEAVVEEDGMRRSRRVTKGQKFEYWKNERPVYNQGDLVGLMIALPTPAKPTIAREISKKATKTKLVKVNDALKKGDQDAVINTKDLKKRMRDESTDNLVKTELKPIKLPKNVKYIDRKESEELNVWSDASESVEWVKCVSHREQQNPLAPLPVTATRPPGKDKVGFAAKTFNVSNIPNISDWVAGFVELPPTAIKDAEGVGDLLQIFFVADCQDLGLELALADPTKTDWSDETAQRQLLRKGDSFYVPPGNIYRLENHSLTITAVLNWVFIRPNQPSVVI